jgi:hypothetical protein
MDVYWVTLAGGLLIYALLTRKDSYQSRVSSSSSTMSDDNVFESGRVVRMRAEEIA